MKLDNDSFELFAAKHYDMKTAASSDDFYEDLKRFQYLKRLFKRYSDGDELRIRLILNHLIVLYNCFGPITTNLLFMRLPDYHKYLKPFIVFLNYMPETIEYSDIVLISSDIYMDENIVNELRKI